MTEADFQRAIVDLAHQCGWQAVHVRPAITSTGQWVTPTSTSGWPDLVLWKPGKFILREIKTDKTKLESHQRELLRSLLAAGIDASVWRPADWDNEIKPTLAGRKNLLTAEQAMSLVEQRGFHREV